MNSGKVVSKNRVLILTFLIKLKCKSQFVLCNEQNPFILKVWMFCFLPVKHWCVCEWVCVSCCQGIKTILKFAWLKFRVTLETVESRNRPSVTHTQTQWSDWVTAESNSTLLNNWVSVWRWKTSGLAKHTQEVFMNVSGNNLSSKRSTPHTQPTVTWLTEQIIQQMLTDVLFSNIKEKRHFAEHTNYHVERMI